MAVTLIFPVTNIQHLNNLVRYVRRESKTVGGEYVYFAGCSADTITTDFARTRALSGERGTREAYQVVQSFKAGEVDIDTAFRLAKEYAERVLPNYQYVVTTHSDRDHVHTHIVFCAYNEVTGQKYIDNLDTLSILRSETDELCREYGLSIIQEAGGLRRVDKTTYTLALENKSWKIALLNDLDALLGVCSSPAELTRGLEQRGYRVVWTDRNISILKEGEKKAIRVDTLARQFGYQYTKENIELALDGKELNPDSLPPLKLPKADYRNSEWSRYERSVFGGKSISAEHKPRNEDVSRILRITRARDNSLSLTPLLIRSVVLGLERSKHPDEARVADAYRARWVRGGGGVEQKASTSLDMWARQYNARRGGFGNVTKDRLLSVAGNTITVRITEAQRAELRNAEFFYAGEYRKDGGLQVVVKETNKTALARIIGVSESELRDESPRSFGTITYKRLRNIDGETLSMRINEKQKNALVGCEAVYSGVARSDGSYLISFKATAAEAISAALGNKPLVYIKHGAQDKYGEREQGCSLVVSKGQYEALSREGLAVTSYFVAGEQYVTYREAELMDVCRVCGIDAGAERARVEDIKNKKNYRELKLTAAHTNDKIIYRVVSAKLFRAIEKAGLWCAHFPKDDKVNVAFRESDLEKYKAALIAAQAAEEQARAAEVDEDEEAGQYEHSK